MVCNNCKGERGSTTWSHRGKTDKLVQTRLVTIDYYGQRHTDKLDTYCSIECLIEKLLADRRS